MTNKSVPTIVVVGGGSAGCVVAHHLAPIAQLGKYQVVLVEQGGTNPLHDEPNFLLSLEDSVNAVSRIPSVLVEGKHREPFPYVQAKTLGGGSAVNGMVVSPLHGSDFDEWDTQYGCSGWGSDSFVYELTSWWPVRRLSVDEVGSVGRTLIDAGGVPSVLSITQSRFSGESLIGPRVADGSVSLVHGTADSIEVIDGKVSAVSVGSQRIEADIVVLACGAVATPLLLRESGLANGFVGKNAQDHPALFFTVPRSKSFVSDGFVASAAKYFNNAQCIAYEVAHPTHPDLGLVSLSLLRVESCGTVSGSLAKPEVHLNLLGSVIDRECMRNNLHQFIRDVVPHFIKSYGQMWCDTNGSDVQSLLSLSDAALDDWLIAHVEPHSHISGTCAMGASPQMPVTPRGEMRGVQGMYVADASVFPHLPQSNTNMVTVRVASRIANYLVEDLK